MLVDIFKTIIVRNYILKIVDQTNRCKYAGHHNKIVNIDISDALRQSTLHSIPCFNVVVQSFQHTHTHTYTHGWHKQDTCTHPSIQVRHIVTQSISTHFL